MAEGLVLIRQNLIRQIAMVTYDLLLTQDNFKSERVAINYYSRTTDTNSDSSRQAEM